MRSTGLGDLLAGGHHRIEREFRILQDQPGTFAADAPQRVLVGAQYVDVVEGQLVGGDARVGGSRLQN